MRKKMIFGTKAPYTKMDINEYIVSQMKRKVSPFYMKRKLKIQILAGTPVNSPKQGSMRRSQGTCILDSNEKNLYRNKMRSQVIAIQRQKQNDSNICYFQNVNFEKKYEILRKKVQMHIVQQKKKAQQKQQKLNRNDVLENMQQKHQEKAYHKHIITTLSKPFDYGQLNKIAKVNKQNEFPQQLFFLTQNLESIPKVSKTERVSIRHNRQSQTSRILIKVGKKKKLTLKSTATTSRNSIFNENSRGRKQKKGSLLLNSLNRQKPDNIDLQFQEGLVEDIYTAKRIKFRKKINEAKSRKNIYDGKLYFLKE